MAERRGSHTLPAAGIGSGVSTGGTKKNTGDLLTAGQNLGFDRPPQKIKNAPIYVRVSWNCNYRDICTSESISD